MVIYENIEGGLVKAYSDQGVYIHGGYPEADYVSATDPADAGRTYTETDIPIEQDEATIEEKAQAYDILTGGAE